jgi:hypothetical protein
VPYQADIWDEEAGEEDEDERGCPCGDFVGADAGVVSGGNDGILRSVPEVWICLVRLHGFGGKEEEDPYAVSC